MLFQYIKKQEKGTKQLYVENEDGGEKNVLGFWKRRDISSEKRYFAACDVTLFLTLSFFFFSPNLDAL